MNHIQTVKIHDVEDGETYTAKIQKKRQAMDRVDTGTS